MAESFIQQDESGLSIARHYPVPPEKVWRAWTDPQALSRWFGPGDTEEVTGAQLDVRVGGHYSIAFRTSDGEQHKVGGTYQEVVPNRKLSFTWAWQSTPDRVSFVIVEMRATSDGTHLEFRHERFFNEQALQNHKRGWTGTFAKLDAYLQAIG
jgi:uncharacterized protein YndB with AHSA1/START domain